MQNISSFNAKTHLPQLLRQVVSGESFVITRHGVPIARLVPYEKLQHPQPSEVIQDIRRFRKKLRLSKINIRQLIEDGRRY